MKRIVRIIQKLKINQQFTVMVIIFVLIPTLILSAVLFSNIRDTEIQNRKRDTSLRMTDLSVHTEKMSELCSMTTQVFLNMPNLNGYLVRVLNKEEITFEEIYDFRYGDIAGMQNIVNSNPYLYQIRIYVDDDNLTEIMPFLYRMDRMREMEWADSYQSGSWQYDYTDHIFRASHWDTTPHIMSLVTDLVDPVYGQLGVLEVAIRMDELYPELYRESEDDWAIFLDEQGKEYYEHNPKWGANKTNILSQIDFEREEMQMVTANIGKESVLVAAAPFAEQGSWIVTLSSLQDIQNKEAVRRNIFWGIIILVNVLLMVAVSVITRLLLRRIYNIFDIVDSFSDGNLDAAVSHNMEGEMKDFARIINRVLDKIRQLMTDNVNREVLAKNSEIRALQNQINAHFIYNVLESIKMMAEIDEHYEIADAVTSLGKLLRYSMRWTSKNVSVAEELEYIKNYLALINLRFDYEVSLNLLLSEQILNQEIPKMSLQPIVENAVLHGIEDLAEDTEIQVWGELLEDAFFISVRDTGKGMGVRHLDRLRQKINGEIETQGGSGNGIGLKNVQDRIHMSFGRQYGIEIQSEHGQFTEVTVKLPLKRI